MWESDFLAVLKGVGDVHSFNHFTYWGGGHEESYSVSRGTVAKSCAPLIFPFYSLFSQ